VLRDTTRRGLCGLGCLVYHCRTYCKAVSHDVLFMFVAIYFFALKQKTSTPPRAVPPLLLAWWR